MRTFTFLFSNLIAVCLAQSIPAFAGAFTNGSFELPGGNSGLYLNRGDTNLTAWTIGGNGGWVSLVYGQWYFDFPPADGSFQITFNGGNQPPGTWIEQTFDTIVDEDYVVTFQVGRLGTQPGSVSIAASARSESGELLADVTAIPPSHGYGGIMRMRFTAKSALTTLRFLDTSVDTASVDVVLDNVRAAVEVPQLNPLRAAGSLEIGAQIDGLSRLVIQTNRIYWDHLLYIKPGQYDTNMPTRLNGFPWFPSWPSANTAAIEPSLPLVANSLFTTNQFLITQSAGRGTVSIVQEPSVSNEFTLILQFDDVTGAGPNWYEVTLQGVTTTIPPSATIAVASVGISWSSESNRLYQILYSSSPRTNNWVNLGSPVAGIGGTMTVFDSVFGEPHRFYQVVALPSP